VSRAGEVQTEVMQRLTNIANHETWQTVSELAGTDATRSRIESVRRAVMNLQDAGHAETQHVISRRQSGGKMRHQLAARLSPARRQHHEQMDAMRDRLRQIEAEREAGRALTGFSNWR
jgi:hypothetical protein